MTAIPAIILESPNSVVVRKTTTDKSGAVVSTDDVSLKRFQCHKQVWALKIGELKQEETHPSSGVYRMFVIPANDAYPKFELPDEFVQRHKPQAGGWIVVYEDGYVSWSPAKVFEDGYHQI